MTFVHYLNLETLELREKKDYSDWGIRWNSNTLRSLEFSRAP
jgi:hypothetical protein